MSIKGKEEKIRKCEGKGSITGQLWVVVSLISALTNKVPISKGSSHSFLPLLMQGF